MMCEEARVRFELEWVVCIPDALCMFMCMVRVSVSVSANVSECIDMERNCDGCMCVVLTFMFIMCLCECTLQCRRAFWFDVAVKQGSQMCQVFACVCFIVDDLSVPRARVDQQ